MAAPAELAESAGPGSALAPETGATEPDTAGLEEIVAGDPGPREARRPFDSVLLLTEETREELEWRIEVYDGRYGYGLWATLRKDRDELIGRCGLLPWRATETPEGELVLEGADEHPVDGVTYEIELAYLLGREHWGLGLATEAARAIVDHALRTLRPTRLICLFDPRNVASRRVAERVGFTFDREVILDGERLPMHSMRFPPLD